jgi:hypothetical protein
MIINMFIVQASGTVFTFFSLKLTNGPISKSIPLKPFQSSVMLEGYAKYLLYVVLHSGRLENITLSMPGKAHQRITQPICKLQRKRFSEYGP